MAGPEGRPGEQADASPWVDPPRQVPSQEGGLAAPSDSVIKCKALSSDRQSLRSAMGTSASYLCLSFLICKIHILIVSIPQVCFED